MRPWSAIPGGRDGRAPGAPLAVLALFCLASGAGAQTIGGVLSERGTYAPIDLASVILVDEALDTLGLTITDERGYFRLAAPESGAYYLIASALGYQAIRSESIRVGADEVRIVELSLDARPVPVEGLLVEADAMEPQVAELRPTGFYDRMADGRGEFITPGQIAASDVRWPQQLFWGMRSVRVHQRSHERPGVWDDALVIPKRTGSGYCEPSIYVDGVWMRPETNGAGLSVADMMSKEELLGVEVYEWPFGVPHPYVGQQACGVILFWTEYNDEKGGSIP